MNLASDCQLGELKFDETFCQMGDSGFTWWGVGGSAGAQHRSLQVSRFYQQAGKLGQKI